jgi:hypothetical protein
MMSTQIAYMIVLNIAGVLLGIMLGRITGTWANRRQGGGNDEWFSSRLNSRGLHWAARNASAQV